MEGSSFPRSDLKRKRAEASKFLADFPSRGLLSSVALSTNLDGMRNYICLHDTSPPDGQEIKTIPSKEGKGRDELKLLARKKGFDEELIHELCVRLEGFDDLIARLDDLDN